MVSKGRIRAAKEALAALLKKSSSQHMGAEGQRQISAAVYEHKRLVKKRLKQLKEEETKRGF